MIATSASNIHKIAQDLGLSGDQVFYRENGKKCREQLVQELMRLKEPGTLAIDFSQVTTSDSSFIDEAVLRIQAGLIDGEFGQRGIVVKGANEEVSYALETCLAFYALRKNVKLTLAVEENDSRLKLLWSKGHFEPHLGRVFEEVEEQGRLTSRDLAQRQGLSINDASNRLRRLYQLRLVHREEVVDEQGKQHVYCRLL